MLPITRFLRSILRAPHLASYVRELILDGNTAYNPWKYTDRFFRIPVSDEDLTEPVAFVERSCALRAHALNWIQNLRLGSMDAFVAVLVLQLRNLRSLRLGPDFSAEGRLLGVAFQCAVCGRPRTSSYPAFHHLKEISIDFGDWRYFARPGPDLRDVLPFFYVPSVEHITVSIRNPDVFSWPDNRPPIAGSLTSLDIRCLREGPLGDILSATPSLKTLKWFWFFQDTSITSIVIDLDQAAKSLSCVQSSLSELIITADTGAPEGFLPTVTTRGSLKGIVEFPHLKKFSAPLPFLLGLTAQGALRLQDVIPRHVEFLTITDDLWFQEENEWNEYQTMEVLRSWLVNWRESAPNLLHFHFLLEFHDEQWLPPMREDLRALGNSVGLETTVTKLRNDVGWPPR
jgi:hypothetical protein